MGFLYTRNATLNVRSSSYPCTPDRNFARVKKYDQQGWPQVLLWSEIHGQKASDSIGRSFVRSFVGSANDLAVSKKKGVAKYSKLADYWRVRRSIAGKANRIQYIPAAGIDDCQTEHPTPWPRWVVAMILAKFPM